jgi:hypothetical protein
MSANAIPDMPTTLAPATDWFRADVFRGKPARVDRAAGVIYGYKVMTKGETHDKRGVIDEKSLTQIETMGNAAKLGVKGRFGHPAMSSDALGTFLGRSKNFRREGDSTLADFHVDPSAHATPNGDLANYVMDLAESDPDAFGASVVVRMDKNEFQADADGKVAEGAKPLLRFKALLASDVVDSPAANSGLFGETNVKFSAEMTAFLDQFLSRGDAVERVLQFLGRYAAMNLEKDNMEPKTAAAPTTPTPAPAAPVATKPGEGGPAAPSRADFAAELKKFTDTFGAENGVKWFNEGKSFADAQTAHIAILAEENKALKKRIADAKLGEQDKLSAGGDAPADPTKTKKPVIRIRK